MKIKLAIFVGIFLFSAASLLAQGGRAEPKRVKFASGKTSQVLRATFKEDGQQEYVFSAKKGQKVKAKIASSAPKGKFHAFKIEGVLGIDYLSESDTNYALEFVAPQTGDYMIFVRMLLTEKVRSGKFALTLNIK